MKKQSATKSRTTFNKSNKNLSFIIVIVVIVVIIIIIIIIIGFKKYFGHSPGFPNRVYVFPIESSRVESSPGFTVCRVRHH